jgi:precorrin-6Y C5,15-methyltransferase (decarboxylating)
VRSATLANDVTVVGVGADGWDGLAPAVHETVLVARTVLGGSRHLQLLPDAPGQARRSWLPP